MDDGNSMGTRPTGRAWILLPSREALGVDVLLAVALATFITR